MGHFLFEPGDKFGQPVAHAGARRVAQEPGGFGDVGIGEGHVAGLLGVLFDEGLFAADLLEGGDQLVEGGGLVVAEVDDFERGGVVLGGAPSAIHDVVHIGVVAPGVAVAVFGDGATLKDVAGEFVDGQVRTLAGAVNGEVAQCGDSHAVEAGVVGAELLGAEFAGGVGREGGVDGVVLAEGHLAVDTVDGGGGGEGEAAHAVAAAGLQEVERAKGVDLNVEARVLDGGAHAGLGGDVDDGVGPALGENALDKGLVADVALEEAGAGGEGGDVAALDLGAVEVVEVVEGDHVVALGQDALAEVGADEARRTCY